jgi:hypothetical protein
MEKQHNKCAIKVGKRGDFVVEKEQRWSPLEVGIIAVKTKPIKTNHNQA